MGFWHLYMGLYGGGTAAVTVVPGTYTALIGDQGSYERLLSESD